MSVAGAVWRSRLPEVAAKQLPYAARVAVNETGKVVRLRQLERLAKVYTIRRPGFARQALQMVFAVSGAPVAALVAFSGKNADVFAQHEPGQVKTSTRAGGSVTVPVAARPDKAQIIKDSMRPRVLLERVQRQAEARFQKRLAKNPNATRPAATAGRAFILEDAGGERLLMQRRGRGRSSTLVVLYELKKRVALKKTLGFVDLARRVVPAELPRQMQYGLARALSSARWGSGTRTGGVASTLPR